VKILVTGDIHNEFSKLNDLIRKKEPDLIICCGDFGYWPRVSWGSPLSNINLRGSELLFCDGNHEDFWSLKNRISDELSPDIHYMPRGSTFTLNDGRTILFMGGAESIDKDQRTIGIDWFPDETIQQKDLYDLPNIKVDIFITHTCPVELMHELRKLYNIKNIEPSNWALSELWKIYKPSLWLFGHWHVYRELKMFDTKCYALGTCNYPKEKWWIWLPEK
jgi:predicted phosphodiesterase